MAYRQGQAQGHQKGHNGLNDSSNAMVHQMARPLPHYRSSRCFCKPTLSLDAPAPSTPTTATTTVVVTVFIVVVTVVVADCDVVCLSFSVSLFDYLGVLHCTVIVLVRR